MQGRLLDPITDDLLLERIELAVAGKRNDVLKEMLIQLQTEVPTCYTQIKLFETALLVALTASPPIFKVLNWTIFRDYLLPKTDVEYEQLKDNLHNFPEQCESAVESAMNCYLLLEFAVSEKTTDLDRLTRQVFVEDSVFNKELFAMNCRVKCQILLQNRTVMEKIDNMPELRIRLERGIDKFGLHLVAALFYPKIIDIESFESQGLQRYVFYLAFLGTLQTEDEKLARHYVERLYDLEDDQTLFFVRHIICEFQEEENGFMPLWKTPSFYKRGVDDRLKEITSKALSFTFDNAIELSVFLNIAISDLPVFLWKFLLYERETELSCVLETLKHCRYDKDKLIVDFSYIGSSGFAQHMEDQANSVLHYQMCPIPLELAQEILQEPFEAVDLKAAAKITDKLIGLGTLSPSEVDRFERYVTGLPITSFSEQMLASSTDSEVLFALLLYDAAYGNDELRNWIDDRGMEFDMVMYIAEFSNMEPFMFFKSDAALVRQELGMPDTLGNLILKMLKRKDLGCSNLEKDLLAACNLPIHSSDELRSQFRDFQKFVLKNYRDDMYIIYIIEYLKLRVDNEPIDASEQATETQAIILLSGVEFTIDVSSFTGMLRLATGLAIPNRCLFKITAEEAINGFGKSTPMDLQLSALLYLELCESVYGEHQLHAKAVLFSRLTPKQQCISPSEIASTIATIQPLLETLDFWPIDQLRAVEMCSKGELDIRSQFRILNCCFDYPQLIEGDTGGFILDMANEHGFDLIFSSELYKPYVFEGERLFDILGMYERAIQSTKQPDHLLHRLSLLNMEPDVLSPQEWRGELKGVFALENNFDDSMCREQDLQFSDFVRTVSLIRPLSVEIVCFIAGIVHFGENVGQIRLHGILETMPAYIVEPLVSAIDIKANNYAREFHRLFSSLESYVLVLRRAKQLQDAVRVSDGEGGKKIASFELYEYKFDESELQNSFQELIALFDQTNEPSDYVSAVACDAIVVILEMLTFDDEFLWVIDRLSRLPLISKLNTGIVEIVGLVQKFPELESFSKVSKLIKQLLVRRGNNFLICQELGLPNPLEMETRAFLMQLLLFLGENRTTEINCEAYDVIHPITKEKVYCIALHRFSSQNLVFKVECRYDNGTSSREVVKISQESYIGLLNAQRLFAKINESLRRYNQLFPSNTFQTLSAIPIYAIESHDTEISRLLREIGIISSAVLNVVIMPFVNFECVFDAIRPFLNKELKSKGIELSDELLDEIQGYDATQFRHFENRLSFDYLGSYFSARAGEMHYSLLNRFIVTYSASTLVCAILGIGDRHLDNICIDEHGNALQIDLEHMFFGGLRLQRQEVVPLRYTKIFQKAIPETSFKCIMLKTFEILRADGLLDEMVEMAPNSIVRLMVRERADSRYRGSCSPEQQIERLIDDSKSEENLVQMYKGWMPWL